MNQRLREEQPPAPHALFYCREKALTEQLEVLERLGTISEPMGPLIRVLNENIEAAVRIAETPAVVAIASGFPPSQRRSQLTAHNLVLRLGRGDVTTKRGAGASNEALDVLKARVLLWKLAPAGEVEAFVNEPLRQATVLLWAALEFAINRVVATLLTWEPDLLISDSHSASLLRKALSIGPKQHGEIPKHGVGDWFENYKRLRSLGPIREAIQALFPESRSLQQLFESQELTNCAERRHLIAHRAGIVDLKYQQMTREGVDAGTLLVVTAAMFSEQVAAVAMAGADLVYQASLRIVRRGN